MSALEHRGGHGNATFFDSGNGLTIGHLFGGTFPRPGENPLPALTEDGPLVVTIDGSISNVFDFLEPDAPQGDNRDTQALLELYRRDEEAFPAGLKGYFAFVLWDGERRTISLGEDLMGRKPLYYYQDPSRRLLVFASELKGLLAHPAVPRVLDDEALSLYLSLGYVPAPYTMIRGARKLEVAQRLTFSGVAEPQTSQFWHPEPPKRGPESLEYWLPLVRQELEGAVARVSSSTKRVGAFLSGGVDSSILVAALRAQSGIDFKAFTLAFTDGAGAYDLPWAKMAAAAVDCPHEILMIDPSEISPELVDMLFRQMDEPLVSAEKGISHHFLLRAARDSGYDSILIGSGAESNFGYGDMRSWRKFRAKNPGEFDWLETMTLLTGAAPLISQDQQKEVLTNPVETNVLANVMASRLKPLLGFGLPESLTLNVGLYGPMGKYGAFNAIVPPLTGQESRTPFQEEGLFTLTLSIPPSLKGAESASMEKAISKRLYEAVLQMPFDEREKRAMPSSPRPPWLDEAVIAGLLKLGDSGIVKADFGERLAKRFQKGRPPKHGWLLFVLHCWLERYLFQREPFAAFLP